MLPGHSPHSDTFRKMPIKHLRRDRIVTRLKTTVCYPLIITTKHGYIENFHQNLSSLHLVTKSADRIAGLGQKGAKNRRIDFMMEISG